MATCDLCGAPLRKAPFSSTIFQNRYICTVNDRHIFTKDRLTGNLVKVAPLASAVIMGSVVLVKALDHLNDLSS